MTSDEYQEIVDSYSGTDVDCANCLMPLQVVDVVVDGNGDVTQVIYCHATTGDMYCEDQEAPHNLAQPRT